MPRFETFEFSGLTQGEIFDGVVHSVQAKSIGFLSLGDQGPTPAGTGTLVSLGDIHGILTAGHVLNAFPIAGGIGLVRFNRGRADKAMVELSLTDRIVIGGPNFEGAEDGPDLGFLKLPFDAVGSLKATNTFYPLDAGGEKLRLALKPEASPRLPFSILAVGVIAEKSSTLLSEYPRGLVGNIRALAMGGEIAVQRQVGAWDIWDFELADGDEAPPSTYAGASGGGLWHVPIDITTTPPNVLAPSLLGVIFREHPRPFPRFLRCHGIDSIYLNLQEQMKQQWPNG